MEENSYNWKLKGLAKGVNPLIAVQEIKRLETLFGTITPEIIVRESRDPKNPLNPIIYASDDRKAAYNHRLQVARILLNNINLVIVHENEHITIDVFEITCHEGGYKSIDTFTSDDVEYIKHNILKEMQYWKKKLQPYKEFDKILNLINQAIEAI